MKICTKCKENKQLDEFHKRNKSKDGLEFKCKTCFSVRAKIYRVNNKVKLNSYQKKYRENNIEQCKLLIKKWTESNKDKVIEYHKDYYVNNKEKINIINNKYRKVNLEKCKILVRTWQNTNLDLCAAYSAKRRVSKFNATPKWLTKEQLDEIETFYTKAKELELQNNTKYHVDHIVPIQGETVSGLHVPWNLQVLTAEENLSKGNKLLDDIIIEITK